MLFLYSLLYSIVMAILLPFQYAKRPRKLRRRWLREKFGMINRTLPSSGEGRLLIWVHAVSVGEVISAAPLIRELKDRYPSVRVVLSTITDTGQKVAHERLSDIADMIYLPLDLPFSVRRLLRKIRPDIFITIETELWPNIFRILKKKGIPILVMNGRLSERSFDGYRKIRFFMKGVVRCVDLFGMQDRIYADRIVGLGADKDRVEVIGNFKFDIRPPEKIPEWTGLLKWPVILAGSTHEGEEELILSVFERLRIDFPGLNLIIAPRHPERFKRVEDLIKRKGLEYVKRSELNSSLVTRHSSLVIFLDVIGELASVYGAADVAIIGGSFIEHGGHNPLEPAFWGKPIICGPHMENFPFIDDFYRCGGAIRSDAQGLYDAMKVLLQSPEKRGAIGQRARALYSEKAGAVNRAMEVLEHYIKLHLPLTK
ncbi:MAG: 3-deoxy-D-manno-octulosonic acid transferase [Thermodesulfovibrionales bacterium]